MLLLEYNVKNESRLRENIFSIRGKLLDKIEPFCGPGCVNPSIGLHHVRCIKYISKHQLIDTQPLEEMLEKREEMCMKYESKIEKLETEIKVLNEVEIKALNELLKEEIDMNIKYREDISIYESRVSEAESQLTTLNESLDRLVPKLDEISSLLNVEKNDTGTQTYNAPDLIVVRLLPSISI